MTGSKRGYFKSSDKINQLLVSLDVESIDRECDLSDARLPAAPEEYDPASQYDQTLSKHLRVFDRRIVSLSTVVMSNADKPETMRAMLGSFPSPGASEFPTEADLLYSFAYLVLGCDSDDEHALGGVGVDIDRAIELMNQSNIPDLVECNYGSFPVIAGAYTHSDLSTLASGMQRLGMLSPFTACLHSDRDSRARQYLDDSDNAQMTVDVLKFPRFMRAIKDKLSLEELCERHGLPGKYLPQQNSSVLELYKEGRVRDLVEYNMVDALMVHFVTLYYMCIDEVVTRRQFEDLWKSSAKQLIDDVQERHPNAQGVVKWLDSLPQAHQLKFVSLSPREKE